MKKLTNLILVMIPYLFYACTESESIAPRQPLPNGPSASALAAFESTTAILKEDDASQQTIGIILSKSALAEGTLVIKLSSTNSVYGVDFETFPAAINGEINLPVAKGDVSLSFGIKPIQNTVFNSARSVEFTMAHATGGVAATPNSYLTLELQDDELAGRLKKYESVSGSWRTSRAFTYDGQGELNGIIWSQHTPLPTTGSYTYHRENGKVVRMTNQFGFVTNYEWREGRVVKSERIEMERLKQRIEYSYDEAGNVGEMVFYDRQPDGSLQRSMVMVFLYFLDGNIYKKLTYYVEKGQEPTLSSTETFENYLEKPNPAPMVETLPHLNPQPNLPRTYRLEIGGQTLEYGIQYQLRSDGLPIKRTVQGLSTTETTSYSYY